MSIDSAPGAGTTLELLLPAAESSDEQSAGPAFRSAFEQPLRVLVIDDDPKVARAMARWFHSGFPQIELDGHSALRRLQQQQFDLILCDLMMPDLGGIELYENLSEAQKKRVIFMTGGAFTEPARAFLERVPNRAISKPFDKDELRAAVASVIGGQSATGPGA